MKRNGKPRARTRELDTDLALEWQFRALPGAGRFRLLAWFQRWRRRPGRDFWLFDAETGEWREL